MNWKDVSTRAAWTFGEAFLAIYTIGEFINLGDFVNVGLLETSIVAGLSALLSVIKTATAQRFTTT